MKYSVIVLSILAICAFSCKKQQKLAEKPSIALKAISHDSVINGSLKDTVIITLQYTIARNAITNGSEFAKVTLTDKRDTTVSKYDFPKELSDSLSEDLINVSGTYTLRVPAAQYLVMRPDHPNGDTVMYDILLIDMEGKESNKLTTPSIYIFP